MDEGILGNNAFIAMRPNNGAMIIVLKHAATIFFGKQAKYVQVRPAEHYSEISKRLYLRIFAAVTSGNFPRDSAHLFHCGIFDK